MFGRGVVFCFLGGPFVYMSTSEGEEPQHRASILLPKWPGTQREVAVLCGSQLVCIGCLATPIRGE